jgi:carbon monoxide dehydrogenase subunit G
MRLGVGFLKDTYHGTIRIDEQRPHEHLRLAVQGAGMLGALNAHGTVRLIDAKKAAGVPMTYLLYEGEAEITGRVAALGQRVIETTASKLIGLFFDCLAAQVER